ncbi:MAG: cyclomaltodextrinase N-terminal domain-containing protein [Sedimentisphaerales bacterium]|nr:cyclomaltodextrinase N-terminal domain-containing protein [Sedimentisphaerales bacterium]
MRILSRPLRLLIVSVLFSISAFAAPVVTKVEPPNWWIGHSWNPVRLLIEGRELTDARLAPAEGLSVGQTTVSANGDWAFVDLTIATDARPGRRTLALTTPSGSTAVPFELLRRLPAEGRFQGFSPDDVIYLAMPDRFADGDRANDDPAISAGLFDRAKPRHYHGGDLAGVIQHLDYLQHLGVTALWLTPWYDNVNHLNLLEKYTAGNQHSPDGVPSTDYHGYGAVDFYGVEEHFGDLSTLQNLVTAAHRHQIKIIQDQVANHTGPYHRWTTNAPTPTWYNGTVADHLDNTWQTWTIADPNAPADKLKSTLDGWFINLLPDLNQNDPRTAVYLIQNSLWWIDQTGLDAIRQDTLPYVPRAYWSRWTTAIKREHPHFTILGEMWDGNPKLVSFFQGGRRAFDGIDTGVDTLFDFPLCYAIRDVFAKHQSTTRLAETLASDGNYVNPRVLVIFLGLHDMPRFLNEPGADLIGLRLAFTFLLTTRGTPLIYYGDEIAMRGGGDPDCRRDFPGGFPGDARNAFTSRGRTAEQAEVYNHVQQLLQLRRELEPLRRGDLNVVHASGDAWACIRKAGPHRALVVINNGTQTLDLDLAANALGLNPGQSLRERLRGRDTIASSDGALRLSLPARSSAIYSD